jgi:hypothetical protein
MTKEREADLTVSYARKVNTGQYENAELRATARYYFSKEQQEQLTLPNASATIVSVVLEALSDEVIAVVHDRLSKATGQQIKSPTEKPKIEANFLGKTKFNPEDVANAPGGFEEIIRKTESKQPKKLSLEDL